MSGSGREAFTDVREWSEGPPNVRMWSDSTSGCPGVVGRLPRMTESGWEALSVVPVWSGDPFECPGCPPGYPVVVGRPTWFSGSGREALPDVWVGREAFTYVQEWSGGPPGCQGVVDWLSRMAGSGGRPLQISGSCQKNLPDGREW